MKYLLIWFFIIGVVLSGYGSNPGNPSGGYRCDTIIKIVCKKVISDSFPRPGRRCGQPKPGAVRVTKSDTIVLTGHIETNCCNDTIYVLTKDIGASKPHNPWIDLFFDCLKKILEGVIAMFFGYLAIKKPNRDEQKPGFNLSILWRAVFAFIAFVFAGKLLVSTSATFFPHFYLTLLQQLTSERVALICHILEGLFLVLVILAAMSTLIFTGGLLEHTIYFSDKRRIKRWAWELYLDLILLQNKSTFVLNKESREDITSSVKEYFYLITNKLKEIPRISSNLSFELQSESLNMIDKLTSFMEEVYQRRNAQDTGQSDDWRYEKETQKLRESINNYINLLLMHSSK